MKLTHIWRGYGSAIFLNFGELHHSIWKNGRVSNNPVGEMSVSITWSWRIEGKRRIWCGSWSEESQWQRFFDKMIGATVADVTTYGRLPEIELHLSCGARVLSFMTANGDPEWAIHDRRGEPERSISVAAGRFEIQTSQIFASVKASDVCMLHSRPSQMDEEIIPTITSTESS